MMWPLLTTAFTTGLLGSLHCLGMCGGVSAMTALAAPLQRGHPGAALAGIPVRQVAMSRAPADFNVLAFNAGRIGSYAIAGSVAGAAGGLMAAGGASWLLGGSMQTRVALFFFANVMIILTGLFLMGMPQFLAPLEIAGGRLWRYLSPLTGRLLPLNTPTRAAAFGMVWGWIPCGMVYAMLLTAMSAGGAAEGALTMLAFGAGTLPAMLGAGWSAGKLLSWTRNARIRSAAGLAVIAMGLFGLARLTSLDQLRAFGALCSSVITGTAVSTP